MKTICTYCSYQISGSTSLSWHTGARYWVATGQYAASRICGLCVAFRGTVESGSPIPTLPQYAQSESSTLCVVGPCSSCPRLSFAHTALTSVHACGAVADDCPECAAGSLDFQVCASAETLLPRPRDMHAPALLGAASVSTNHGSVSRSFHAAQNSYGSRDPISWQPVQCAVGDSPLQYSFQGSNPWYLKLQVSNGRYVRGSRRGTELASSVHPEFAISDVATACRHHQQQPWSKDLTII